MEPSQQTQQGSGSGEHKGQDRGDQPQSKAQGGNEQRQLNGEDIDEGNHAIADLGELGMSGGREGQGGGAGGKMNEQNTGETTAR